MAASGKESKAVPESVMEAVRRTSTNMEEFVTLFPEFLSLCDPEVLAELPPLQRAQSLLLLAKATTTLFTLRLRCNGVDPENHPVKTEIERLNLYQDKLERFIDLSKAPLRRATTLNQQAATRVIGHSLPDLTSEQRQSMRDLSKGEGPKMKYVDRSAYKKRKYQSSEKQNVRTAAQEFLEKAARELLGENNSDLKGPFQPEALDEDDVTME